MPRRYNRHAFNWFIFSILVAEEEWGLVPLPQYQHGLLPPPLQLILLLLRLGSLDWWVRWLPLLVGLLLAPLWWVISRVILVTIMFSWAPKFIDTFGIGVWCCTGIRHQLPTTQLQGMCLLLFCLFVGFYPTEWKFRPTHIMLPVFIICVHLLWTIKKKANVELSKFDIPNSIENFILSKIQHCCKLNVCAHFSSLNFWTLECQLLCYLLVVVKRFSIADSY